MSLEACKNATIISKAIISTKIHNQGLGEIICLGRKLGQVHMRRVSSVKNILGHVKIQTVAVKFSDTTYTLLLFFILL